MWDVIAGGLETILSSGVRNGTPLTGRIYVGVTSVAGAVSVTFFLELNTILLAVLSAEFTISAQIPLLVQDSCGLRVPVVLVVLRHRSSEQSENEELKQNFRYRYPQ